MRNFACFLLLCSGSVAVLAAETWRWVDASGVTHYSDRPVPGAVRIDLQTSVRPAATPAPAVTPPARPGASTPEATPAFLPYTRCVVNSPANDQVFQSPQNISVSLEIDPVLQGEHRIEVLLNGRVVPGWPAGSISYSLTEIYRGSYTLNARVVDEQSRTLCAGAVITFHVRQPSVNSPARRPAG